MDLNKLGNVQRDIIKDRRLTDTELEEIKEKVNRFHRITPNTNEIEIGTTENQEGDVIEEPSVSVVKKRQVREKRSVITDGQMYGEGQYIQLFLHCTTTSSQ
ncbi:Hypothetical predicted protein [Octopus vulgaris]|uniref:Uncharacterized protein n=1 Tax=Octopus vulgaris TaxID=6645 RepID=A0AA36B0S5_OCTVU|nr:Hypothetical predicted protein [Octopus vulgaris]